ncbi:hypothetical protein MBCUR_03300 [Methanobrevibacter curvatus]|uniref:Uncharacterized protein n=1 Tax=Methanobrevibacter curvatus TaxID=49547 RepID=A0A166CXH6_9EURY|nr:hypothetical protein MBCUR_03300 [Methanobrevibacter curvatus]
MALLLLKVDLVVIVVIPPFKYNAPPLVDALFLLNLDEEICKFLREKIAPPFTVARLSLKLAETIFKTLLEYIAPPFKALFNEKFELLNILVVPPLIYTAPPLDVALFLLNIEVEIFKSFKEYIAPPLVALFS